MLDDGSECKKEIHSTFFFSLPLPPVPLSGEMDPSEDPSTRSRQAAGKSGSKRYDAFIIAKMWLRFTYRSVARTFWQWPEHDKLFNETVYYWARFCYAQRAAYVGNGRRPQKKSFSWVLRVFILLFSLFFCCCFLNSHWGDSSRVCLPHQATVHPTHEHSRCLPTFPLFQFLDGWLF